MRKLLDSTLNNWEPLWGILLSWMGKRVKALDYDSYDVTLSPEDFPMERVDACQSFHTSDSEPRSRTAISNDGQPGTMDVNPSTRLLSAGSARPRTPLPRKVSSCKRSISCKLLKKWSGRPGSNRRRPAWEAGILPLNYSRLRLFSTTWLKAKDLTARHASLSSLSCPSNTTCLDRKTDSITDSTECLAVLTLLILPQSITVSLYQRVGCGGEVVKPWLRSRWASSAGVR